MAMRVRRLPWVLTVALLGACALSASAGAMGRASERIVVVGDFGTGGEAQLGLGEAVRSFAARRAPSTLLTLGDNDYTRGAAFAENWSASFGWLAGAGLTVAGTLGNHDVEAGDGSYQFAALNMPARFYRRSIGRAELFVLDSTRIDFRQTRWLRRALRRSTAPWKIVAMHHPAHTCGGHTSEAEIQRRWVLLFEEHGVELVLAGHDHNYQRFAAHHGVHYVLHGTGSPPSAYDIRACDPGAPELVRARHTQGFLSIFVGKKRLVVKAVNLRGKEVDELVIRR
jgi:hypothetical protein